MQPISIKSASACSAYGLGLDAHFAAFSRGESAISLRMIGKTNLPVAALSLPQEQQLSELAKERAAYAELDRSVLLAMLCARSTLGALDPSLQPIGVNIGSSRGATGLWERCYQEYLASGRTRVPLRTSPLTTLGNIASWVAQDLGLQGAAFSHSVTCSTGLHALANAYAWVRSGLAPAMLAGGSEAPLTDFGLAQMQALRIYSQRLEPPFCRPLAVNPQANTLVLGEGAALFILAASSSPPSSSLAEVQGMGFAQEQISSATGLSENGDGFVKSIQAALRSADVTSPGEIDAVVMHAPGTMQGDAAELRALQQIFGEQLPLVCSCKHLLGHTFGAAGSFSLLYALWLLHASPRQLESGLACAYQRAPVLTIPKRPLRKVLVNSAGFGGNCVSVLLAT
jgi:3-oxoacyl-[acyl-carrier-protein] synthase II